MNYMLIRHKVADFNKWKPHYDENHVARQEAGLTDRFLWHNEGNPNDVVALFEVSSMEKAKKFADSSELRDKMVEAGVEGPPEILFLSED